MLRRHLECLTFPADRDHQRAEEHRGTAHFNDRHSIWLEVGHNRIKTNNAESNLSGRHHTIVYFYWRHFRNLTKTTQIWIHEIEQLSPQITSFFLFIACDQNNVKNNKTNGKEKIQSAKWKFVIAIDSVLTQNSLKSIRISSKLMRSGCERIFKLFVKSLHGSINAAAVQREPPEWNTRTHKMEQNRRPKYDTRRKMDGRTRSQNVVFRSRQSLKQN